MATVRDGIRTQITNTGELGTGVTVDSVDISGIKLNSMPTAADGEITLSDQNVIAAGTVKLGEQANAEADTAAYGQLWVKTATPNELYFTNDAGDDVQLTSGSSMMSLPADDITVGDAAISVATSSGNVTIDSQAGSVSVDGHTGVTVTSSNSGEVDITSAAAVDINATTGVTIDGTTISIDGTDSTNLTMTANSSSAKALTIDAVNSGLGVASITLGTTSGTAVSVGHTTSETTVNDNLTVTGDLTVNGTTTTINSTTLTVDDKVVVIASGAADSAAADGAGISVDGASATILYDHTGTQWEMNKPLEVTGAITSTGDITSDTGSVYLKEKADATADTAAYGQLWVNTATPNELYFTTDAGNDIQLTSGSAMAFVGDITGVTAGVGLSGGGTAGALTLTLDLSELSTVTPADGDFLATLDSDGANEQKTTTTALATLFSGTGLTASSSVIGVDAAQTQITSIGTIATGTWQGTAIASAYLDADTAHLSGDQTFTGTKTLNSFKGTGGATVTNILDEDAMGSNSATALATQQSIKAYADTKSVLAGSSSITTVGTVGTGVWNGTAVASAYLDADTAHLTTSQTFSGAKAFTGGVTIDEGELTLGSTVVGATGAEINAACDASARTAAAVAVADDHFLFCDGAATGATKVESIADLMTGIAGTQATTGLVASSGTLVVTDLHPVGVSGSANQLLTDDGDGTVTSEAKALVDGAKITIGDGTAEDSLLVFDGNSQDFAIGIDNDEASTFRIAAGNSFDATAALEMDTSGNVATAGTMDSTSYKNIAYGITGYGSATGASSTSAADAGTLVIAADTLVAGDRLRIHYMGNFTAASTPAMAVLFKISDGSNTHTLITASNASAASSGSNHGFVDATFLAVGSSGKIDWSGLAYTGSAMTAGAGVYQTLRTNADVTISVNIQFDASHASNTFTLRQLEATRSSK